MSSKTPEVSKLGHGNQRPKIKLAQAFMPVLITSNFVPLKCLSWVLRPFQEYFTYIEPIVHRRWAKTGVPGEKPPDHP